VSQCRSSDSPLQPISMVKCVKLQRYIHPISRVVHSANSYIADRSPNAAVDNKAPYARAVFSMYPHVLYRISTCQPHMAISACSFRSSSSSSSSSTRCCCGSFWFGACGSRPAATVSLTGTLPVLSISSSSFSCCNSASSSSSSSSSMPFEATPEVMASLISSPIACCSRRSSLWGVRSCAN
jgi:hypothetical protein